MSTPTAGLEADLSKVIRPERPGLLQRLDKHMEAWITGWNPYDPAKLADKGLEPVVIEESAVRKKASRWFMLAFVGFGVWAFTAPLDAGVPVVGNVVVSGYRKAVQHPTGGVVTEILTSEGATVKQGDILIRVNPLNTEANLENVESQYINLLVNESRLRAERLGAGSITWTPELANFANDPRAIESKAGQSQLFNARRAEYGSQISGLEAQIRGLNEAIQAHRVQVGTLADELKNSQQLASEGYVPRSQVNQILRNKVEQEAAVTTALSEISKLRSQIAQTRTAYLKDIETQLAEIQKTKGAMSKGLQVARFDQSLSEIRAPVAGTVVGLKVFTVGGVISGGEVLMEVVPTEGNLIVEAKVEPKLIDKVKVGLEADMRFVAFNQTTTPVINGKVKLVGVDLRKNDGRDPGAPGEYYLAQVETTPEGLKKLADLKVQPGMPVDVIIKTGERTFMSYLLKPLTDKLARAFKD